MEFRHPKYGKPAAVWAYHQADGAVVGYAARFNFEKNGEPDKEYLPITFCEMQDGNRFYRAWRSCGVPSPRPLYALPRLLGAPNKTVIITEGEGKADRAVEMFPECVATTTMGGARAPQQSDLGPLIGRRVIIWPDNDDAGRDYALSVAELAFAAGASSVAIVQVPPGFPTKWDLANTPPEGVTEEDLRRLLASAEPFEKEDVDAGSPAAALSPGYSITDRGLIWRDPSDAEKPDLLIAGKFEVVAETRDGDGTSWGVLLGWKDHDGHRHEFALPRSALAGDGIEARKALLDGGLYVAPSRKARDLLTAFLASVRSPSRARATNRIGWHGAAFVLPDQSFGCATGDRLILQGGGVVEHSFGVSGTLQEWQEHVACFASGNSRLLLALSAAFAGPLVGPCSAEGGGIHFRGASSTGKTTALAVAGSAWGGGEPSGYVRSWRATANGLEGVALGHSDTLLCLDEMSQLKSSEAGEVAYMIANGSGKSRSSRDGSARRAARWQILFLSSGEIGLADKVAEDGRRRRPAAGQQVRIVDVPADAGAGLGIFEKLHDFESPEAFARQLRASSITFFGTAARAFIERIVGDIDHVKAAAGKYARDFVARHVPTGADAQVERVAQRFGLIAAAGEIAATYEIVPWEPGEATAAAARCFSAWLTARGGIEASEVRDGIAQVRAFILSNGMARFLPAWEHEDERAEDRLPRSPPPIRELAGFRRQSDDGDGWEYFVTTSSWRNEVCAGFDAKATAGALADQGLLILPDQGPHRAKFMAVPRHCKMRLYHLPARLLEGTQDD